MDVIGRLALSRGDYAVIDYTLPDTEHLIEGNYSMTRRIANIADFSWRLFNKSGAKSL